MSYATYFPEQRHLLALTTIRRERLLPPDAIGVVEVRQSERVDLHDSVAHGTIPSRFVIIEALQLLKLRKPEQLFEQVSVEVGEMVEAGQVIAGKATGRGRRITAPITGVVAHIGEGRIIIQETPEAISLDAGLAGSVVDVYDGRGVAIETVGAVLQGVWGNGKRIIATIRTEPERGLETIFADNISMEYQGAIVITRRPLKAVTLQVIADQGLRGIIAPSMEVDLIDEAMASPAAIMLVNGFGSSRLSQYMYSFLESLIGRPGTLDATPTDRFSANRPEIIVHLPGRGERPAPPNMNVTLSIGMNVRLTRGTNAGLVGRIVQLPPTPQTLENGLRVQCAQVELANGANALIPLANLEAFG